MGAGIVTNENKCRIQLFVISLPLSLKYRVNMFLSSYVAQQPLHLFHISQHISQPPPPFFFFDQKIMTFMIS